MVQLETRSKFGSGSDKTNKRHKYTLYRALQAVFEFDDESDYSYISD